MKVVKWILIALALLAIVFFTVPSGIFCSHSYSCTDNTCTKCGLSDPSTKPSHTWQAISCSEAKCTVCGKTNSGNYHNFKEIPCTGQAECTACHEIIQNYGQTHSPVSVKNGCTNTTICTDCGKVMSTYTSHKWVSENCKNDYYCKNCGTTNYPSHLTGHMYNTSPFSLGFIETCNYCGDFHFQMPNALGICAFIGLLMSIAAFIFVFINRKRIRIREGKYLWTVTPDAHLRPIRTDEEHL